MLPKTLALAGEAVHQIAGEIKAFVKHSPMNLMPEDKDSPMFDEPVVQFADGDDPIFEQFKKVVHPTHLTPRVALARAFGKRPEAVAARVSVVSWILPITSRTRESNRRQSLAPSRQWMFTRWYGEKFNDALRQHVVGVISDMGYLAAAPALQPYFKMLQLSKTIGYFSKWSERHIAYAAGLGTFSLSDGFITEHGIAHRIGSVVTNLPLPASSRTAPDHQANCLFYHGKRCIACIARCPAGAITEQGHDKMKCYRYIHRATWDMREKYNIGVAGCGLCQTKVPCEFRNPVAKLKKP